MKRQERRRRREGCQDDDRSATLARVVSDIEHLKLIESIITRLAGNSFLLKGWAVTLVAGLTALAKSDADRDIAWIALGAITIFGLLDAYYLAHERGYRELYEKAAAGKSTPWSLTPTTPGPLKILGATLSPSSGRSISQQPPAPHS
jgi:hypothetical protein